jgi:hypothetical protein
VDRSQRKKSLPDLPLFHHCLVRHHQRAFCSMFTISLFHFLTILLFHYFTYSLFHLFTISLIHYFTISLSHFLTFFTFLFSKSCCYLCSKPMNKLNRMNMFHVEQFGRRNPLIPLHCRSPQREICTRWGQGSNLGSLTCQVPAPYFLFSIPCCTPSGSFPPAAPEPAQSAG